MKTEYKNRFRIRKILSILQNKFQSSCSLSEVLKILSICALNERWGFTKAYHNISSIQMFTNDYLVKQIRVSKVSKMKLHILIYAHFHCRILQ